MKAFTPSVGIVISSRQLQRRRVERAVRWAALLLIVNAGLVVTGWMTGVPALTAPFPGVPPMPFVGAFVALANAVALWALASEYRRLQLTAALSGLVTGSVALGLAVTRDPAAVSSLSLAGAVLGLCASLALSVQTIRARAALVRAVYGTVGVVLIALSLSVIGARLFGMFDSELVRFVLGASPQGLFASIVIGACLLTLVWLDENRILEPPRWVPIATGIACMLTVLLLWRALDARERDTVRSQQHRVLDNVKQSVGHDLDIGSRMLSRAAYRLVGPSSVAEQTREIANLLADVPGLATVLVLDATGKTVRGDRDPAVADGARAVWAERRRARNLTDTVSLTPLDSLRGLVAMIAPICGGGTCRSALVGIFDGRELFSTAAAASGTGHHLLAHPPGGSFPADALPSGNAAAWREDTTFPIGQRAWRLAIWPATATLRSLRSSLTSAVLVLGLVVSALLPVALSVSHQSWRLAHERERSRMASALERSTDGIWEWDLLSGASNRSERLWRHLGYDSASEVRALPAWASLIHDEDRPTVESALAKHIAGDTPTYEAEYRVRGMGGEWHAIVDHGRVVDRSADGHPSRLMGISADVTETRRTEHARDVSERRFRATFDSGFQFQLVLDAVGIVLEVNRAALERAGVAAEEVVGRPVAQTLWWARDGVATDRLDEQVRQAAAGKTMRYEDEIPENSGASMILEVSIKPIADAEGEVSQLLVEARDVTARRRVDAALSELDTLAAMGGMAARVAHEINNPLAGIQYSFLLIKDAVPKDHPHYRFVGAIDREIERIAAVTRQLYETYRPEKDVRAQASLTTIIGDAVAFLEQVNRSSSVRVVTDLTGTPAVVLLSAAVLRQIVYNLVQNAMDASPESGTVRLTGRVENSMLELKVSDSGPGVAPELRTRIFEPFFSTKTARMRSSGMGLGLALVKRTVVSAGGTIRVETAPGGGAEFIVSLPLTNDRG